MFENYGVSDLTLEEIKLFDGGAGGAVILKCEAESYDNNQDPKHPNQKSP